LFRRSQRLDARVKARARAPGSRKPRREDDNRETEARFVATKEYLQSVIEDHGLTTDDLGSANEELFPATKSSKHERGETARKSFKPPTKNSSRSTTNSRTTREVTQINNDLVILVPSASQSSSSTRTGRSVASQRREEGRGTSFRSRPADDINPHIALTDLDQQVAEVIETSG
jgi:two-component system CheB/CheR fusion protein